jgi:hypothetical protein
MACAVGLFAECHHPVEVFEDGWIIPCVTLFRTGASVLQRVQVEDRAKGEASGIAGTLGRPSLDPDQITDIRSTGRKRAARALPILDGMPCAWMGLKFAGGGPVPIVGCRDHILMKSITTAEGNVYGGHLHHGPDKNVLNNTPGVNLHAVCTQCHNRWHAVNNIFYERERPSAGAVWLPDSAYWPHDPTTQFEEGDAEAVDAWFSIPVEDRPEYPFYPSTAPRLPLGQVGARLSHNPFTENDH